MDQAGSGSTTRSAVSPWPFAQSAKNATRRCEMIRASLQVQPGTRQAGRTGGSVALWRSHWCPSQAPFVLPDRTWVGLDAATLGRHALQTDAYPGVFPGRESDIRHRSCRLAALVVRSRVRAGSRTCGDVWFRQGLVTGEREPRTPLGLVNQVAKRSTWQPPVDSRSRCLGSRVSVEAASASRAVEASSSEAAIRASVT